MALQLNLLLILVLMITYVMAGLGNNSHTDAKQFVETKVRIIGGEPADPYQFPEMVSIQRTHGNWPRHFCGGTILNEEYVLTAAHCLLNLYPHEVQCVSATNDLLSEHGRVHQVVRFVKHHVYRMTNLMHDIGLIQVTPKFKFDGLEGPTKLPPKSFQVPVGAPATVVGWGRTEDRGKAVDQLQFVTNVVIDLETCNNKMRNLVNAYNLCGAREGPLLKGFCRGDSGGPFFYKEYQIGLVSWFVDKCGDGPSVYTKLSEHIDWINENIAPYTV